MTAERDRNPPGEWADKVTYDVDSQGNEKTESPGEMSPGFRVTDRRHWVEGVDEKEVEEAEKRESKPAYVQALEEELRKKDETLKEYISQYKAAKQSMNESISRIEREKEREVSFRIAELAKTFLSIVDDLKLACDAADKGSGVQAIKEGVELIMQRIYSALREIGIEQIEALGKAHDPRYHDAVGVQEVDDPDKDGVIMEELKKGYVMGDVLVRPASVLVGKFAGEEKGSESNEEAQGRETGGEEEEKT